MRALSLAGVFAFVATAAAAGGSLLQPREAANCTNVLKNPPPGGTVCEKTGYVRRPNVIATAPIASFDLCRDYCIGNPKCLSFSYAANNQSCTHYRAGILNSGFVRTPSGAKFANRRCYTRVCSCPADSGETLCGNQCVDLSSDLSNCGSCGNDASNAGNACCAGSPTDTDTSPDNCGACGNQLQGNENACCNGSPKNTDTDTGNCGSCGTVCSRSDPTLTCRGGECVCATQGQTQCGTQCVDLNTDDSHCGTCDGVCGSGSSCYQGSCHNTIKIFANGPNKWLTRGPDTGFDNVQVTLADNKSDADDIIFIDGKLISVQANKQPFIKVGGSRFYYQTVLWGPETDSTYAATCVVTGLGGVITCTFVQEAAANYETCNFSGLQDLSVYPVPPMSNSVNCKNIVSFSIM